MYFSEMKRRKDIFIAAQKSHGLARVNEKVVRPAYNVPAPVRAYASDE